MSGVLAMAATAAKQKDQDRLKDIKERVKVACDAFQKNNIRFHKFKKFTFESSLTEDDLDILENLKKPQIEFNISEAYVSRLLGEFAKQEPGFSASSAAGKNTDPAIIQFVEDHIRYIVMEAKNHHNLQYHTYKNMLGGGFGVVEVCVEYENPWSFDYVIKLKSEVDPTLCFFDPLAQEPTKWDGNFCGKLYPMRKEEFLRRNPGVSLSEITFTKSFAGFSWSYSTDFDEILLLCDYYEKKEKTVQIVKLANQKVMELKAYKEMVKKWDKIAQPPAIIGKPRETTVEVICRYLLIENQILEYEETDWTYLPLVFFDGNSEHIRQSQDGSLEQVTKPYTYQLEGLQRLKNFAGQTLANEFENMVQHKWKVSEDALPSSELAREAYKNPALSNVLMFKEFKDDDPNVRLTPPMEIQRVGAPPELINTFMSADQMVQSILGSFDAAMGNLSDSQLSGVALQESATQSNSAAMPYIVGFLEGLNQVAQIILDLLPKYYLSERTIPVMNANSEQSYVQLNSPTGLKDAYKPFEINVKVEAGVNFSVQKSRAIQQLIGLSRSMPVFAEFMNFVGLETLLDNLEIRGVDQLKKEAKQFMAQKQQQAQQQQQIAMQQAQNNPMAIKQQELQIKQQQNQAENALELAKIQNDNLELQLGAANAHQDRIVEVAKVNAENLHNTAKFGLESQSQLHEHAKDAIELTHNIMQDHIGNQMQQHQMNQNMMTQQANQQTSSPSQPAV
jgi:hypothetical protein